MMRAIGCLLILFGMTSLSAYAVSPYHPPCEDQGERMDAAFRALKSCLNRTAYRKKAEVEDEVCKKQSERFKKAKAEYEQCVTGSLKKPEGDGAAGALR